MSVAPADLAPGHRCADSAPAWYLYSGHRQPGDQWTCPDCGKAYEFVNDEAEGSAWWPVEAGS